MVEKPEVFNNSTLTITTPKRDIPLLFHLLQDCLQNSAYCVIKASKHAYRTERTYCQWILRYIHHFGGETHPGILGAKNIEAIFSHLATGIT